MKIIKESTIQKYKNKIGETINRWLIKDFFIDNNKPFYICDCLCGETNNKIVSANNVFSGRSKSCGCYKRETTSKILKKYNQYDLSGDYGIGFTSNTNNKFYFDLEDYDKIKNYCWMEEIENNGKYKRLKAWIPELQKTERIHKIITNYNIVDHKNRNPLDNRKNNLRDVTHRQNDINKDKLDKNTSGIIGVSFIKDLSKWRARIQINNKETVVYYGDSFEDAVIARLKAEKKYYQEFAPQKHLYQKYGIT